MNKKTAIYISALGVICGLTGCGPISDSIEIRPDTGAQLMHVTETVYVTESAVSATETNMTEKPVTSAEKTTSAVTSGTAEDRSPNSSEYFGSSKKRESTSDNRNSASQQNSSSGSSSEKKENTVSQPAKTEKAPETTAAQTTRKPEETTKDPEPTEAPAPSPTPEPEYFPPAAVDNSTELKYAGGVLIVNKTYAVPEGYEPSGLVTAYGSSGEYLLPETNEAFRKLKTDAAELGYTLWCQSGYRSYSTQNRLYTNYCSWSGKAAADTYSARPGHSEHHTGLALDLNTIDDSFAYTPEGQWVAENCYRYGFIIRYPKSKESITGYKYEPWHLRYVGTELAAELYSSGLCLEEYFGLTSQYSD